MERFKLVCFWNKKKNNEKEYIFDTYEEANSYREQLKATDKKLIADWCYIATIYN